jgi:hypothetical protein
MDNKNKNKRGRPEWLNPLYIVLAVGSAIALWLITFVLSA